MAPAVLYRRESKATRQRRFAHLNALLKQAFPGATTALRHRNPFELLVATMLSAQCTDVLVNKVTPGLFAQYPNAKALAAASVSDVHRLIARINFAPTKARNLNATANLLVERHQGQVPQTMAELTELPGVGRKTANVVLGNAFGKTEGIVVDTHVGRIARRLAFTIHDTPKDIEADLMVLAPRSEWTVISHRFILHGRQTCKARGPRCGTCELRRWCPSRED